MLKKTGNTILKLLTHRLALNLYVWFFFIDTVWNNNHSNASVPRHDGHVLHIVLMHLVWVAMIYGNTMIYIPRLLIRRKYGWYLLVLLAHALLFSLIIGWYSEWLIAAFPGTRKLDYIVINIAQRSDMVSYRQYLVNVLLGAVGDTLILFTIGRLMQYFFVERRRNELLEKKQLESELMLLRSQINPHFLFNVLNSIYSLSLKKSDEAPGVILKLSDILRYMLYESRQDYVPLDKELQMLRDYIAIEQIRISSKDAISLDIGADTGSGKIAPALLIAFVENAVKHGLDSRMADAFVRISIRVAPGQLLEFQCVNNYLPRSAGMHTNKTGGIGLENVKKRLELLYPGKHHLTIDNDNTVFQVKLTLKLSTE
ncbi:sensor histidine kinase [Taibaiella koreensis]|uniref:sensor histidine kinase n=1 Tax=Taibaiella koreensis TaxID=1268548 RepID=UPI000E5A06A3|nr:histidine kinase [Taibaiella koreensis]